MKDKIKNRRIQLGLTQSEVAKLADINQADVSKLESGGNMHFVNRFISVLNAIGLDIKIVKLKGWRKK